ncbi:hypothetical protein F4777DRAFT_532149 [Nemania sp. FL0916]|nr:hypothetical protein F4777DRAFT_532149 [Nemania sp. FL0916]
MNISRIDGSKYGAVLFSQPSPAVVAIARSRAVRVYNAHTTRHSSSARKNGLCPSAARKIHSSHLPQLHPGLFPSRSLCTAVAPALGRFPGSGSGYFTPYPLGVLIRNHAAASAAEPKVGPAESTRKPHRSALFEQRVVQQSKDEILSFVDYYDDAPLEEYINFYRDPYRRGYAVADGPNLFVSDRPEDLELQPLNGDRRFAEEDSRPAQNLRMALDARRRRPADVSLDTIWDLYQELPNPGPAHITARTRHALMAALASTERKNQKSMLRYFTVVADVKNSGFALTSFQWNTAISFATSYVATTTEVEVEAALKLWRDMEREAHVKANDVTFNILFDSASKAGKFHLAEMIYREMIRRGYVFNRYHHVTLIHYFGLKMDSGGVRAAYKEMVEAGEIIDSVVLNCLIASFIRCGEEPSAEYVYEKMKASNQNLPVPPHRDYTMAKAITKVLSMFARVGRKHPSMRPSFQKLALLSPDLHTYRILINHYGVQIGNLSKVAQFLDEMKVFNIPLTGIVFLALFQSFAKHGGLGSDWSFNRLGSVWEAFLDALDSDAEGLHISTWLAMAALEAHARYSTREELLDVYGAMRARWDLDHTNSQYMLHFLQNLLKKYGLPVSMPQSPSYGSAG